MTQLPNFNRLLSRLVLLWLGLFFLSTATAASLPADPREYKKKWADNFLRDIQRDFSTYMKNDNLILLGDAFLASGILANSGLDRAVAAHWQSDVRSKALNTFFVFPKAVGDLGYCFVPMYFGIMAVGHLRDQTPLGNVIYHWGYRSFRTSVLGGIQQALFAKMLGSGRPNLGQDSKWQPLKHNTAVSGHAFYGAVPFLTAAMMSDPPALKYGLYAFSTLPGLSRINSHRHYLSQVILGWTLAFLSARTVYDSDLERDPLYQVGIYPKADGAMLAVKLKF